MSRKVIITVGGTGGHIFPALALAKQLQRSAPDVKLMFVGGNLATNPYFDQGTFLYRSVDCSSLHGNLLKYLKGAGSILRGWWQSRTAIREFKPDLIVGFGSYYTLPTLLAAKMLKVPIVLHEANSIPGKVNRLLARHAVVTGIHFPSAASLLDGKTLEVGMPLREGFHLGAITRVQARDYFFLDHDKITLLVFGGSQGAQAINKLVSDALTGHYKGQKDRLQVLHFTGDKTQAASIEKAYSDLGIRSCVKDFEKRMDYAWQSADLMISRSGAGTIAEQMEFEVPGILIPYPQASENHQNINADFMAKTVGGAVKFLEKQLTPALLAERIETILNHDHILLHSMRGAMRAYKRQERRKDLCALVLEILDKKGQKK